MVISGDSAEVCWWQNIPHNSQNLVSVDIWNILADDALEEQGSVLWRGRRGPMRGGMLT
jgi:hypothetical protein